MKDDILSRAFRIRDARAAAAFADPLRRRLVLLLVHQECSLAELADLVSVELKRLHYHVTTLCKLGLLVIAREQRRAGRPVKIYRAVADAFFVPEKLIGTGSAATLALELRSSLDRLRDRSRDGVIYHLSEDGKPRMRPVQSAFAQHVPAAEYWKVLRLSRAEALRLAKDIEECFKAHNQPHRDKAQSYLVHFAFAPSSPTKMRKAS